MYQVWHMSVAASELALTFLFAGSGNKMLQVMREQWPNLQQALRLVNTSCRLEILQPVLLSPFMME